MPLNSSYIDDDFPAFVDYYESNHESNDSSCNNESLAEDECYYYDDEIPIFRHTIPITVLYCVAYILVSVMGVIGNSFVVAVVVRAPRMRSVTNVFIANLAVADLLVNIIVLPTTLIGHTLNAWVLGLFVCKAVTYFQGVSVSASINTLVALTVDRALAICYPMRCQITTRTCRVIIAVIWVFSLTITLPWAIVFKLKAIPNTDLQVCTEEWPDDRSGDLYFVMANLVMCYLLPLIAISICYFLIWRKVWRRKLPGERQDDSVASMIHRSKIKVIKMLVVVVILFALSWLPLYVIFARLKLGVAPSEMENSIIHVLAPIAQWLGASNSCINPILYAFFNDRFRSGFKAIVTSRSCCSSLRLDNTNKSFVGHKAHHNLANTESKASSEFSVYSSSCGSAETTRKAVMVQIPVDGKGQATGKKRSMIPTTQKGAGSMVLYKQCIINNFTNGTQPSTQSCGNSTLV